MNITDYKLRDDMRHKTIRNYSILMVLLFSCSSLLARDKVKWSELQKRMDSCSVLEKRSLWVEEIDTTNPNYIIGLYETVEGKYENIAAALLNFEKYPDIFKHFVDTRPIPNPVSRRDSSLYYYLEGKTLWLGGWGAGRVDSLSYDSTVHITVKPIDPRFLERYKQKIRDQERKLYYVKSVNLRADLVPIDEDHSRLSIVAWTETNKPMPIVILDIVLRLVMPSFLNDLENFVEDLSDDKVVVEQDPDTLLHKFHVAQDWRNRKNLLTKFPRKRKSHKSSN